MNPGIKELEQGIFEYIDKFKLLVSPQTWENVLMDCSKNEVFVMLLLYRRDEANMTQIAEYIQVPLNTATGIVARMEKKELLQRRRSEEDKRVVTIRITDTGLACVKSILSEFLHYGQIILNKLTAEELKMGMQILEKIFAALDEEYAKAQKPLEDKKIRKIPID
ncbi:MAG: MarR family transcriptional regulator [Lachnospiraceae bacterium]|jgi:DNA-binding MarR family transcriptional regulator|nr:MarR family transcriptional regulator [Lachnospiraceae bacterium]